jgi:hypothetical protein
MLSTLFLTMAAIAGLGLLVCLAVAITANTIEGIERAQVGTIGCIVAGLVFAVAGILTAHDRWRGVDVTGYSCRWEFNSLGDGLALCSPPAASCVYDATGEVITCRTATEAQ